MPHTQRSYTAQFEGYRFRLDAENVSRLKGLPDFEGREEPAVAEEFLRARAETWADALAAAGAAPAEFDVHLDPHDRRAHLQRGEIVIFRAEI